MSPKPLSDVDRGSAHSSPFRHAPFQIAHVMGNFMRLWSVYSMYYYLLQTGASVVLFIFCCLVPASIIFLISQKPWKGRPLSNTQVIPSVINGAITALYFILWGKSLKSIGPQRTILAEYSGAVLGVLSGVLYGRRGHMLKKLGGLIAMLASFYFLSQGWSMTQYSPFNILSIVSRSKENLETENQTQLAMGITTMITPIFAGILSALRRVIARRVSLKNQFKRRLHAITIASATCFLFPVAMWDIIIGSTTNRDMNMPFSLWAYSSFILFGIVLTFYVDSIAEERLHMVFSSPRHLMVAGGCIIVLETLYKTDFSLPGFLVCSMILGFGIYQATSLEHTRKDSFQRGDLSNGSISSTMEMSSLPT
ncbi:hypothetical protein QQ045_006268 [Rhodiola kirilowii]